MSDLFWHVVVASILVVSQTEAARILAYFPTPSISHQAVFRPLTEALARLGHEVTVVTADPAFPTDGAPLNLTETDVHDLSYGIWRAEIMKEQSGADVESILGPLNALVQIMLKVFKKQLENEKIRTLINAKHQKHDLHIVEAFVALVLAFSHIYKIPVTQVSSVGVFYGNYESVGASTHPLLYPLGARRKFNNLTMWEKLTELYYHFKSEELVMNNYNNLGDSIVRKHFGDDVPAITELMNNVEMLFLNIHPMLEGIRPVPPSVIYMSGLHQKPTKELPKIIFVDHPKVKVFITQGGLQSKDEGITAGVPLIGMPMLGDQWFNVERYVIHKIGVRLDMEAMTEENFKNSILAIVEDDSYRRNMERFRSLIQDPPQSPLERAMWWTEYVLRHGSAKHLRSPSANITWWQYLELELLLTVLAALFTAAALLVLALRLYKFVLRNYLGINDVKIKRN